MIESALLRWVLTVVFGGTAVWFLLCTARRGVAVPERISSMGHVVMSSLTVPMAWTWGMQIPTLPQIAVLSLAAVWFSFSRSEIRGRDPTATTRACRGGSIT